MLEDEVLYDVNDEYQYQNELQETTLDLSNQEIIELLRLQIYNDVQIHRINILLFGALFALIVIIAFFKGVFNNA